VLSNTINYVLISL